MKSTPQTLRPSDLRKCNWKHKEISLKLKGRTMRPAFSLCHDKATTKRGNSHTDLSYDKRELFKGYK